MRVRDKTKLILAYRSGDRCALPDCGRKLSLNRESGDPTNIGDASHIAGKRPGSTRYNPSMTEDERNCYNNLIYLCKNCNKKIDAIPQGEAEYTVERLLQIKSEHEHRVRDAVTEKFADIAFPELEEVTQWVLHTPPEHQDNNFSVTAPMDKIKKNDLSSSSRVVITMGLGVVKQVGAFVETMAQTDPDFPQRLKAGFMIEYYRLREEKHRGDDLFDLMCRFAQRGFSETQKEAAGRAVLIYLFEKCEVFEK